MVPIVLAIRLIIGGQMLIDDNTPAANAIKFDCPLHDL